MEDRLVEFLLRRLGLLPNCVQPSEILETGYFAESSAEVDIQCISRNLQSEDFDSSLIY